MTRQTFLEPTQEAGRALMMRRIAGPVAMLNLLRFRGVADYSATPRLASARPISGRAAFQLYIEHTLPHLRASGGELMFLGEGGTLLIGPADERWDMAMLVRQHSVEAFMTFASNAAYLAGMGHRTAAVEDSRLLPLADVEMVMGATKC
jgi:virulence-associated protein VagC